MTLLTAVSSLFRFDSLEERLSYFAIFNGAGITGSFIGWTVAKLIRPYLLDYIKETRLGENQRLLSVKEKHIEYNLNATDVYSYYLISQGRYTLTRRGFKLFKNIVIVSNVVCLFFAAILVIFFVREYILFSLILVGWVLVTLCVVFVLIPLRLQRVNKITIVKEYGASNHLVGKHHLIITDKTITDISSIGEFSFKWNTITELKIIESYIFISISIKEFLIIPRRAFLSEGSFTQFSEEIQALHNAAKNT
jgi:YcxB-like protein